MLSILKKLHTLLKKQRLHGRCKIGASGFTLLEILVVLTIMGFLIAMVAPRLAGLSNDAAGTVCDTNKGRGRDYVAGFYEKFNRYPNKLTNVVITDGTDADAANNSYQIPPCADEDPDNGAEVIRFQQSTAFRPVIHRLNAAEAQELIDMGITKLVNLNDYSGLDDDGSGGYNAATGRSSSGIGRLSNWVGLNAVTTPAPQRDIVKVQEGLGVAMSGVGAPGYSIDDFTFVQSERNWGMDETFGRILLTIGPDSELLQKGMITKAGNSPGGQLNSDLFTFSEYWVILPRLEATSERLRADGTFSPCFGSSTTSSAILQDITELIWNKGEGPDNGYVIATNSNYYSVRTGIDLTAPQEPWEFAKQRNQDDVQYGYNLNGNASLQ